MDREEQQFQPWSPEFQASVLDNMAEMESNLEEFPPWSPAFQESVFETVDRLQGDQ